MPFFRGTRLPLLLEPDIRWLLRDEFTSALAAGSVHGTAAEPGPGTRTVVDIGSNISLSGSKAVFAGGTSIWKETYLAETPLIGRTAGTIGIFDLTLSANNTFIAPGFGRIAEGFPATGGILFYNDTTFHLRDNNNLYDIVAGNYTATNYKIAVALRAAGCYWFLKGGAFTNWTLLMTSVVATVTDLVPYISSYSAAGSSDFIHIPTILWLPIPLLSDGFGGTWPTSDGLGHAEGIAGGMGIGGGGLTWTAALGTWGIAAGVASCSALDGGSGLGIATIDAGKADVLFSCVPAYSAGSAGVIVRYADAANYSYVIHDGTNVKLFTVTTADPYPGTQRGTAVKAPAAGARLVVDVSGAVIRVYYNEVLMFTYATMPNTTATKIGMFTTNINNTFNDFVGYAKGTGGEYSILDKYSRD